MGFRDLVQVAHDDRDPALPDELLRLRQRTPRRSHSLHHRWFGLRRTTGKLLVLLTLAESIEYFYDSNVIIISMLLLLLLMFLFLMMMMKMIMLLLLMMMMIYRC